MPLPSTVDVRSRCERLRHEPLLHASLGSKELFHSNLLGWMVVTFPKQAREILDPWLRPGDHHAKDSVQREWRHIDLRLDLGGCETVLIENKTFSLPREDQLVRYVLDALPHLHGTPSWLLLSLVDPQWRDGTFDVRKHGVHLARWQRVSYRELGERIRDGFANASTFAEQVVLHEAELMLLLDDLVDLVTEVGSDDPFDLPPELIGPLRDVRLADVVGKVRMQAVLGRIRRRLWDENVQLVAPRSKVDFTNGTPLIELFATIDPASGLEAGWQFQGGQWRLALVMHGESLVGETRHHLRVEEARRRIDLFDFDHFATALGHGTDRPRHQGDQRAEFNRFAPQMVYRHRKLPTGATIGQFVDAAVAYAHRLARHSGVVRDQSDRGRVQSSS